MMRGMKTRSLPFVSSLVGAALTLLNVSARAQVNSPPDDPPVVWIETIDSATSEPYDTGFVVPGKFLIHRSGPTNGPLRVFLQYGGTASNGVDYRELPPSVEIPAAWPFAAVLEV